MPTLPVLIVEPDDHRAEQYARNLDGRPTARAVSVNEAIRLLDEGNRYEGVCVAGSLYPPSRARQELVRSAGR